ncbi:hypothetical protein M231_02280 [Tremella mesenterica]|uniref:Uncharacterized protein n=1 Tax=Tremella mesenterica TaxID=5217 RepID=A0A4V1M4I1_TREME|nr:hypothetical protein M231_02280 [Tremella mesenterica]
MVRPSPSPYSPLMSMSMSMSMWSPGSHLNPTAATIKRKNASFLERSVQGKNTQRPARSGQRSKLALWVIVVIGVLAGGTFLVEFISLFVFKKRLSDICKLLSSQCKFD